MTSDLDIYRSAKLLIDQHGQDAPSSQPCRRPSEPTPGPSAHLALGRRRALPPLSLPVRRQPLVERHRERPRRAPRPPPAVRRLARRGAALADAPYLTAPRARRREARSGAPLQGGPESGPRSRGWPPRASPVPGKPNRPPTARRRRSWVASSTDRHPRRYPRAWCPLRRTAVCG